MLGTAAVDPTHRYRYLLTRRWLPFAPPILFIMLNPSRADGNTNDQTVLRSINFALRWGHGRLTVVDLFAYRSTYPQDLQTVFDPVGPENDVSIQLAAAEASQIIVAWGDWGLFRNRGSRVLHLLRTHPLHCLGLTQKGQPRHPLFVSADTLPVPYPPPLQHEVC